MRRLIAFIVLSLSLLALVLFNVQATAEGVNWSQEYENGTEVVYSISNYDDTGTIDIDNVVDIMGNRLEEAGATNYKIEAARNDDDSKYEVKIVLGSRNNSDIDNILRSVSSSGELSLYTTDGTVGADDCFVRGSAEVIYDDLNQAYIKVEVDEKVKTVVDQAKDVTGNSLLVLWQGKSEDLDFSNLDDEDYVSESFGQTGKQLQSKVLSVLDIGESSEEDSSDTTTQGLVKPNLKSSTGGEEATANDNSQFYYDEENDAYYITFSAYGYVADGESQTTLNAKSAHSFERIFNQKELSYEVTQLYRRTVDAGYGANAVTLMIWTNVAACLLISAYLIFAYGLMAISGAICMSLTALADIALMNLLNIQVTPIIILSVIITLGFAINMLCVYYRRLREDVYRGRSIAKASNEGYRKAISTAIDTTVIFFVIGVVLTLLSREGVKNFALFFIFSSLFSVILVFIVAKLFNNFLTQSTISNKYSLFRIDEKNIDFTGDKVIENKPSLAQKIDVKKNFKKTNIATIAGIVVATASLALFGIFGQPFNYTNQAEFGRLEIRSNVTTLFDKELPDGFEKKEDALALDNFVAYLESFDGVEVSNAWMITDQENPFVEDKNYVYFYADIVDSSKVSADSELFINIEEFVNKYDTNIESYRAPIVSSYIVNPGIITNDFANTLVLMSVAVGLIGIYFLIRYRYTMAISSFISLVAGTFISLGIISLVRLEVDAYVGIAALAGMLLTALLLIPFGNRLSQVKNESKVKVTTFEQREEIVYNALHSSVNQYCLSYVGIAVLLLVLIPISPLEMVNIYIAAIISLLINGTLALFLVSPLSLWFEKHLTFKKLKSHRANARKNKREKIAQQNRNKGAEPEEIIIPGIND